MDVPTKDPPEQELDLSLPRTTTAPLHLPYGDRVIIDRKIENIERDIKTRSDRFFRDQWAPTAKRVDKLNRAVWFCVGLSVGTFVMMAILVQHMLFQ